MLRICRKCHWEYEGDPGSSLCSSCVAEGKKTTIRSRICKECGCTFPGGPRAWYCPECRIERRRERDRIRYKTGAARPLGSVDRCTICGSEYIVAGGNQRYCPMCSSDAIKAADREQGRAWYAANRDPDLRRKIRQEHTAELRCVICGKPFFPRDASLTCSPECSAALNKQHCQEYERIHREERNAQRRERKKSH